MGLKRTDEFRADAQAVFPSHVTFRSLFQSTQACHKKRDIVGRGTV